jgi:dolichol-phosphate mannosyltransferase
MGFQQAVVPYERRERQFGKSRWTFAKRLKLFADFFVGYSYAPIRFISYLGIIAATLGFFYALIVVINKVFFYNPIEGYASLIVVVTIMGGLQMIMMGIIGEYIWRTLDESRSRPRYLIEEELNKGLQSISTENIGKQKEFL